MNRVVSAQSLYESAGRCLEAAHQFEFYLATALLAADGLRSGVAVNVRDEQYRQLVDRLDEMTIYKATQGLIKRRPGLKVYESTLEIGRRARNRLAHDLFSDRSIAERSAAELDELALNLDNIWLDLIAGRKAAADLATALINETLAQRAATLLSPVPPPNAA